MANLAKLEEAKYIGVTKKFVAKKPNSVYGWKLAGTIPGEGYRTYVLELTSQRWRSEKDVDHPVWKHWLSVTKPDQLSTNKVLLYIGGGSNNDPSPSKASGRATRIAMEAGSIVAELGMVPNQPLRFTDSPEKARSEDDLIAYSRVN